MTLITFIELISIIIKYMNNYGNDSNEINILIMILLRNDNVNDNDEVLQM